MISFRTAAGAIIAAVAIVACTQDATQTTGVQVPDESRTVQSFDCVATVRNATVECAPTSSSALGVRSVLQTIGNQNVYVKIRSSAAAYDSVSGIFSFNTTVQNYTDQPWSTANGTQAHPGGVKIFFHSGPTATSGTGAVTVANESGTATFTAANQPYFQYGGNDNSALGADGILSPGETSSALNWQLSMPKTVLTFAFTLLVNTQMPSSTYNSAPPA